jgi:tetratricopeptide (TPR) repeat protein
VYSKKFDPHRKNSLPANAIVPKFDMSKTKPRRSHNEIKLNPWNFPMIERNDEDVPLPKGFSAYAKAKRAEYVEKNLPKAEKYYRIAIKNKERLESSIKDLATVLHQQGRTEEACQFLEENRQICMKHQAKLDNLLVNLKKQVSPSGNFYNRTLALFNLPLEADEEKIKALFKNSSRVIMVEFKADEDVDKMVNNPAPEADKPEEKPQISIKRSCLLHFSSNSGARKTLETLQDQETNQFYWVNTVGQLAGKAIPYKHPNEKEKEKRDSVEDGSLAITVDSLNAREEFSQPEETTFEAFSVDSHSRRHSTESQALSGWRSFVYPLLPIQNSGSEVSSSNPSENSEDTTFDDSPTPYDKIFSEHPLWKQVHLKQTEVEDIIKEDSNFVTRILNSLSLDMNVDSSPSK